MLLWIAVAVLVVAASACCVLLRRRSSDGSPEDAIPPGTVRRFDRESKCPDCGYEAGIDDSFCPHCGYVFKKLMRIRALFNNRW